MQDCGCVSPPYYVMGLCYSALPYTVVNILKYFHSLYILVKQYQNFINVETKTLQGWQILYTLRLHKANKKNSGSVGVGDAGGNCIVILVVVGGG